MLDQIPLLAPQTWKQFWEHEASTLTKAAFTESTFLIAPLEVQLGFFLHFFKANEIDFDYNNLTWHDFEPEIIQIFTDFERVVAHYS